MQNNIFKFEPKTAFSLWLKKGIVFVLNFKFGGKEEQNIETAKHWDREYLRREEKKRKSDDLGMMG